MLYRFLCNAMQREGAKPNPDLAFGLFCYVPLHKIWYGILREPKLITLEQAVPKFVVFSGFQGSLLDKNLATGLY